MPGPLYDLLSTSVYDELTRRLATSIDGAADLEEIEDRGWAQLAAEVGFAPRFQAQRMYPFVDRVRETAEALSAEPELAAKIVSGIRGRAERSGH